MHAQIKYVTIYKSNLYQACYFCESDCRLKDFSCITRRL